MKTLTDPSDRIPIVERVDVLVVGGGMTGVAAALSAARMGEAAGAAAVLSLREEVPPRDLPPEGLGHQLHWQGAIFEEGHVVSGLLDWIPPLKKRDL